MLKISTKSLYNTIWMEIKGNNVLIILALSMIIKTGMSFLLLFLFLVLILKSWRGISDISTPI